MAASQSSAWDRLKTVIIAFSAGCFASGVYVKHVATDKIPEPAPILVTFTMPTNTGVPIARDSAAPVDEPARPIQQAVPKPKEKHDGVFYIVFMEPFDATPESAAIRDAAKGVDWKALNVHWWSRVEGRFLVGGGTSREIDRQETTLVIQEGPPGVTYDDPKPPPSPVISRTHPKTLDDVMTTIKQLRGE